MERLNWVVVILAICTMLLVAREKATQPSFVILWSLLNFVFVGLLVVYRRYRLQLHLERWNSHACQVNNSLYELYRPVGNHEMQVVFFHGLPLEDFSAAHLSTWESEDGSCLWPKTWLAEEFPNAHILVAFYSEGLRESIEHRDMHVISENLMSDLLGASIGQRNYCPVVLVGHSFGGLVIKNLCVLANHMSISHGNATKAKKFLNNVKGIFYYSTPHHGSPDVGKATNILDSPLFKYFTTLNTHRERLNQEFDHLHRKWQTSGLGEGQPVNSGLFHDVIIVPEATAREGEFFNVDESANHFSITKPHKKTSRRFTALKELLQNIATHVKDESRPQNWQRLPEHMKGLDFQLDQVKAKLKNHKTLGFVGMGGLGKTTLAKVAFNELASTFEYTCFVCDVKLIIGPKRQLKEELWKDMHCDGKKVGKDLQWFTLRGKKLLLVLDDITMDRDVEVLLDIASDTSLESRFIVTSRDHHLLKGLDDVYDVPLLDENNSKELFMSHAFPNWASPPPKLASHIDAIVKKCFGLPLTLEVLGQYLKTIENEKHWKHTLEALDKAEEVTDLDQRLWAKLRLSYDGLGKKEQQMFLDATTFFCNPNTNWKLCDALIAWTQAYETTNVWLLWHSLVSRSLVYKVEEDESIQIHDQLKSLGRKIALESSTNGQHRVWERTEAYEVLQTSNQMDINKEYHAFQLVKEGGHNKVIYFNSWDYQVINIGGSTLHQLKNVRFLELDRLAIDGIVEVESCLRKLVLLKCVGLNFFNPAIQSSLVILHIHLCEEFLPSSIGQLAALRVLALSNAMLQDTMPEEIGNLSRLERLILEGWKLLQDLPNSFGNLLALEHLEFWQCNKLEALPESFGNMLALEHLTFDGCEKLEALPKSFGNLSALEHLTFDGCEHFEALPESFGNLLALKHLTFNWCENLETLPESFGNLSALEHLEFCQCDKLEALPKSFGNLLALEYLKFSRCYKLEALPESFGNLLALEYLEFHSCDKLEALPKSFGNLSALEHLEFYNSEKLEALPESFGNLLALEYLKFHSCDKLEALPESFGNLSTLEHLEFYNCEKLEALPKSFGNLSALEHLEFYRCEQLETLPESFGNLLALEHLEFYRCEQLETLPKSFGNLLALEHLEFYRCDKLEALPESFGHLAKLQYLKISEAFNLWRTGNLPDSLAELMALRHLVFDCVFVESIPDYIKSMHFLHTLELARLPLVNELPPWLREMGTTPLALSQKTFGVQDGHFSLIGEQRMSTDEELKGFIRLLHQRAMKKMRAFDFEGAIANLCRAEFGVLDSVVGENTKFHGFLLQERGIAKRFNGDLIGALEDLTAAIEAFSKGNNIDSTDVYDCWKHRGYVNFLLGDLQGAQNDGVMALKLLSEYDCASVISPCLGEELVTYMHFRLTNMSKIKEEKELMESSHSDVMENVRAAKFEVALAIWDDVNATASAYYGQAFFLQERGIIKCLNGDLQGALEDLTTAVEAFSEESETNFEYAYDCWKHRGYVNFLLGDLQGAQNDGVMALRLLSKYDCASVISPCLGEELVTYMHFRLTNTSRIKEERQRMASSHSRVMEKVREAEFEVALAIWDDFNPMAFGYHSQVFFLQERGIIKRLSGNLQGALEDLTTAVETFSEENEMHFEYAYYCWKHRGYVNFLLGDLQGAHNDGVMAQRLLSKYYCASAISPCLGEEVITYMHFRLTNMRRTEYDRQRMASSHSDVMEKVRAAEFEVASDLWDMIFNPVYLDATSKFSPTNLGFHGQAFFFQERGIIKRLSGDLQGALVDLNIAVETFSEENEMHFEYSYDCWKHRAYVNFLLGDLQGAQNDGVMALRLLSKYYCASWISPCLGEESVTYMHFSLTNTSRIEEEWQLMVSSHSCVMEKVRATDFEGALAVWEDFDAQLSGFYDQVFFLEERGVLKCLLRDLHGALRDFTTALEIDPDDYECLKHQGYVKFLLEDMHGARIDAERCVAMGLKAASDKCLATSPVTFLEFNL